MSLWLIAVLGFTLALAGTGLLYRYALRRRVLDVPNERSSHDRPIPRGGGLSFVLVILAGLCWAAVRFETPILLTALLPSLVLVALVGWLDDHQPLGIGWRAASYLLAAGWFVAVSGGLPQVSLGVIQLQPGWLNIPLLILGLGWLTNLYNFMDGADGLAATQAVTAAGAGGLFLWLQGDPALAMLAFLTAAAGAGFLVWNRPPAHIFMGDVGSCFLGLLLGALAVLGEQTAGLPGLVWVILLGWFIWDATLTLLLRMARGERWYRAHRCHAYQRLLQMGWGHRRLAFAFLCYNLLILWPLAAWGYYNEGYLPLAFGLSALLTAAVWTVVQLRYERRVTLYKGTS